MKLLRSSSVIGLIVLAAALSVAGAEGDAVRFRNPLMFYNTDILSYLQTLHKNQRYEQMAAFLYGPAVEKKKRAAVVQALSDASFGYSMKRVGVRGIDKTHWSLTYQRTVLGTNETFKIECALVDDTCRIYIDKKAWQTIFNRKLF